MEGLSSLEGWALIATYFVAMMMLVVFLRKHKKTKEELLATHSFLNGCYMGVGSVNVRCIGESIYAGTCWRVLVCCTECINVDAICFLC